MLEVVGATVRFGGLVAVDQVSLTARAGEVTGLIGPNGAGKTTLFNVVTGLQAPTAGAVLVDGHDVTRLPAPDRARRGVARTFQRLEVFGSMTVLDNVLTAAELRRTWARDGEDPRDLARECLRRTGVLGHAEAMADAVPTGIARLVELARALALKPRLLLLDEPSSGLSPHETEAFAALLGQLAAEGTAVLLVEHDVDLVMSTCTRVHVLDFGKLLAVGTPAEVQADPLVQQAYLGATA